MVKSNFAKEEEESEEQKTVDSEELGINKSPTLIASSSHHSTLPTSSSSSKSSSSHSNSSKRAKDQKARKVRRSSSSAKTSSNIEASPRSLRLSKASASPTIRSRTKTRLKSVLQGPIARRQCTDLSCGILFLISMVVWISLGVACECCRRKVIF